MVYSNVGSGRYILTKDNTLRINGVTEDDAGLYSCEIMNTRGVSSASATVQVVGQYIFHMSHCSKH